MGKPTLKLETDGFDWAIRRLQEMAADVREPITKAFEDAGRKIAQDTLAAIAKPHLPRQGKFSGGTTAKSVVTNPKMEWSGDIGEIGVGFDYSKPGAGGFLITGTPRMSKDKALYDIYKGKKYMAEISKQIGESLIEAVKQKWT